MELMSRKRLLVGVPILIAVILTVGAWYGFRWFRYHQYVNSLASGDKTQAEYLEVIGGTITDPDKKRDAVKKHCEGLFAKSQPRVVQAFASPPALSETQQAAARQAESVVKDFLGTVANTNQPTLNPAQQQKGLSYLTELTRQDIKKQSNPNLREFVGLDKPLQFSLSTTKISEKNGRISSVSVVARFSNGGADLYTTFGLVLEGNQWLIGLAIPHHCNAAVVNEQLRFVEAKR